MTTLYIISIFFCAFWALAQIYMARSAASMPLLLETDGYASRKDADWPMLSIIVPACNEADHLEASLTSLLAQDYPKFELIVINDRSTDATGEILDRLAESDDRIKAVHIQSLPEGWLGKVHALHTGIGRAAGDWYLFTDADVYFQNGALRRAMYYAQSHGLNHLACLPELYVSSAFWLDVAIRSFFLLFCFSARVTSVNRKGSKQPIGIGAFNLVEAASFERTPGFEWLRMEPADDVGLGVMIKQTGAKTRLLNADGAIGVPWYESVGAMIRGLEKNSFGPGGHYSYARQSLIVLLLVCLATVPGLSLLTGMRLQDTILLGAGGTALVSSLLVAFLMPRKSAADITAYLLTPVGVLLMAWIMLRSAYKCWRNDGIDWRGTHYPIAELRRCQRVRF